MLSNTLQPLPGGHSGCRLPFTASLVFRPNARTVVTGTACNQDKPLMYTYHLFFVFMSWETQPRAACMPHGQHTTLTACNDIFWSIVCPPQKQFNPWVDCMYFYTRSRTHGLGPYCIWSHASGDALGPTVVEPPGPRTANHGSRRHRGNNDIDLWSLFLSRRNSHIIVAEP